MELLKIDNLKTYFHTENGLVKSVNGVDFHIDYGESVAIVGESGSGKSVTSLSIMGLIPNPPGEIVDGKIWFEKNDLLKKNESELRKIRGNEIGMIFQDPMTTLNPLQRIGHQIGETIRIHKKASKQQAFKESVELLKQVGIPRAEEVAFDFPHQLSGGMRQRVMIAMAVACNPKLLIADEPTTALDVTIQAQILDLIKNLIENFNMSLLLITHDLGVVAETCDRVIVMYAGKIVEESDVESLFDSPKHPYTVGLLNSMPVLDIQKKRLETIPGKVPSPSEMPIGCAFAPRCEHATSRCFDEQPPLFEIDNGRRVRCWLFDKLKRVDRDGTGSAVGS